MLGGKYCNSGQKRAYSAERKALLTWVFNMKMLVPYVCYKLSEVPIYKRYGSGINKLTPQYLGMSR